MITFIETDGSTHYSHYANINGVEVRIYHGVPRARHPWLGHYVNVTIVKVVFTGFRSRVKDVLRANSMYFIPLNPTSAILIVNKKHADSALSSPLADGERLVYGRPLMCDDLPFDRNSAQVEYTHIA